MSTRATIVCAMSFAPLLAGCSGGDEAEGITYHRDIKPLVDAKCGRCHTPGGSAPFPLTNYQEVSAMKGSVRVAVVERRMPPWLAADGCTDYRGDRSLTDAQIDMVNQWVGAGAPEGSPDDTPVPVTTDDLTLSRVDHELPMPEPYTPTISPDDYRCFLIDWPEATTTYVTGFGVKPGYGPIVHHVIAFQAAPASIATYQALDDAEPGPGWTCFGGPGGGNADRAAWIGAWVPGIEGMDLPEGTGVEMTPGSKIILQMHYNTATEAPTPDQTRILIKTDSSVARKAAVVPFADPSWILQDTMQIPAHASDVTHSFEADPTNVVALATNGALPSGQPLVLYDAGLHMHTLGTHALTRLERADGTSECMLDVPRWDFHWQGAYRFAEPKPVNPGDKIYLECHWDNPGATDISWGEGTADEMCLGIYYASE